MRSSLEGAVALEANMANIMEPTHVVGQKGQKVSMACTLLSALARQPADSQLPSENLCPCDLTDTYDVKTQRQYGPIANWARG